MFERFKLPSLIAKKTTVKSYTTKRGRHRRGYQQERRDAQRKRDVFQEYRKKARKIVAKAHKKQVRAPQSNLMRGVRGPFTDERLGSISTFSPNLKGLSKFDRMIALRNHAISERDRIIALGQHGLGKADKLNYKAYADQIFNYWMRRAKELRGPFKRGK